MTTAAATAALGVTVPTVRISWKPIAGLTTGMKMPSRSLAGWRRSVVAIPDLFTPALRMTSLATSVVVKVARVPVAGVVLGMTVQTAEL